LGTAVLILFLIPCFSSLVCHTFDFDIYRFFEGLWKEVEESSRGDGQEILFGGRDVVRCTGDEEEDSSVDTTTKKSDQYNNAWTLPYYTIHGLVVFGLPQKTGDPYMEQVLLYSKVGSFRSHSNAQSYTVFFCGLLSRI
jgi:hypothetical protein